MLIAAITWFTTARKHFSGPEVDTVQEIVASHPHMSDSEEGPVRTGEKHS